MKTNVCVCRYASSEQPWEVPEWFLDNEQKHRRKPVPVTREMVEEYKEKWKEINARPIKRVAEAKARKKRRVRTEKDQLKKLVTVIRHIAQHDICLKTNQKPFSLRTLKIRKLFPHLSL